MSGVPDTAPLRAPIRSPRPAASIGGMDRSHVRRRPPGTKRPCLKCGMPLSAYNTTDQCAHHSYREAALGVPSELMEEA